MGLKCFIGEKGIEEEETTDTPVSINASHSKISRKGYLLVLQREEGYKFHTLRIAYVSTANEKLEKKIKRSEEDGYSLIRLIKCDDVNISQNHLVDKYKYHRPNPTSPWYVLSHEDLEEINSIQDSEAW